MTLNKKHECSIGKTFKSTLLKVSIDRAALDSDYDFFMVYNKGDEDYTPVITDPNGSNAFCDGRICGTFAEWKKRYVMFRKNPGNHQEFTEYLDSIHDDFKIKIVHATTMDERVLLNLLLNSSRHELNDHLTYNNLEGGLYITYPKWKTKDHVTTVKATIEQQSLGFVLSLSAVMFSRIGSYKSEDEKAEKYKKPMYIIAKDDGCAHRTFKPSPNNYVIGNSGKDRAAIPYSDPNTEESHKLSKNYIFDLVIDDVNCAFEKYIRIEKESLEIEDYIDPVGIDVESFMTELKSKILEAEYVLINTCSDDADSIKLENIVIDTLRAEFGKEVKRSNEPVKDKFNIRIIHDYEYYKKYKLKDEYRKFPGYIVQHLTVENCITDRKEDASDSIMSVLIKELFIKNCVLQNEDLIGDWKERGFKEDVIFLKREQIIKKPRLYRVFKLTINPNGKFNIGVVDDNDSILSEVIKNKWERNNSPSNVEHAIIYRGDVCIIENSKVVPVIDNDALLEGIRHKIPGRGHGRDGLGPRGYKTYNNALYAITDIQRLSFGDNFLYMCGYDGSNLLRKYPKAPNIRHVKCIRGENFFSKLLELMNVPFVRHGQTTVYPYPYKFMTEFIEDYKRGFK